MAEAVTWSWNLASGAKPEGLLLCESYETSDTGSAGSARISLCRNRCRRRRGHWFADRVFSGPELCACTPTKRRTFLVSLGRMKRPRAPSLSSREKGSSRSARTPLVSECQRPAFLRMTAWDRADHDDEWPMLRNAVKTVIAVAKVGNCTAIANFEPGTFSSGYRAPSPTGERCSKPLKKCSDSRAAFFLEPCLTHFVASSSARKF